MPLSQGNILAFPWFGGVVTGASSLEPYLSTYKNFLQICYLEKAVLL